MDGRLLLAAYLKRAATSQATLARLVQCSEGHLSLYLAGKRELSPALAKRISEATSAEVPLAALMPKRFAEFLDGAA